jgi:protein-(glutamine-N5) methyltransferase, release factor-specific
MPTSRLDAEVLLAQVLKTDRKGLYLSLPNTISEQEKETLQYLLSRRINGEPVSYIIGRKEFWSLSFKVNPAVMIPRPETETLIEETLKIFSPGSSPSIVDIGTGSGAISIALATERPQASIITIDISFEALLVAKENASFNGVRSIQFINGNLYEPLKEGKKIFDLIVSNPPYIPTAEIPLLPPGIRDYEPYIAFDGGPDGLELYRKIIREAHHYLKRGGYLLLEVGKGQYQEVSEIISETKKFSLPEIIPDLSGIERVVKTHRIQRS